MSVMTVTRRLWGLFAPTNDPEKYHMKDLPAETDVKDTLRLF